MTKLTIDDLVGDLAPVRRIRPVQIWLLALAGTAAAVVAVWYLFGLRGDVLAGEPKGLVLLRGGTLLLLGVSAVAALAAAARPGVGHASHGWRWVLAAAALFPLVTVVLSLAQGAMPMAELTSPSGPWCLGIGGGSGLAIGAVLTTWLRRGAPVSLTRFNGVAAYEFQGQAAPGHHDGGWHLTGTLGSIAAGAACARLLGLDARQMVHALGIATTQAAGMQQG